MQIKYTLIGFALDLFDWIGIGMIPIIGDVVDAAATIFWYKVVGPIGLTSAIEIIPGLDILPTNIAIGLYADYRGAKWDWSGL
jgi:hypothetical protein